MRELSDLEWQEYWETERAKGKTHYILRGFIFDGLSPGLCAAVLAAFFQRFDGIFDRDGVGWAFPTFVSVSIAGLLHTWWLWRSGEARYLAIRSRKRD